MNDTVTIAANPNLKPGDIVSEVKSPANVALDHIAQTLRLKNDAALSRALEVSPPVVSKIRKGRISFGPSMIIRAHEITGESIRAIKERLGEKSLNRYA